MALIRYQRPDVWSPFQQLSSLRQEIDRLFDSPLATLEEATQPFMGGWMPSVDLFEDKDNFVLKAELPGMKKEEIEISLHEGVVSISGERKQEQKHEDAETYRSERFFGRFHRTISLPSPVNGEKVTANYKDGVLTVTLPKSEETKPKQIPINLK